MLICQTGKAFDGNFETNAGGTLPVDETTENAIVHIERALIAQDGTPIETKALTIDEKGDQEPVGSISKLFFTNTDFIENAEEERSRCGFGVAFFKTSACTKI